jgi:hypothetical protein
MDYCQEMQQQILVFTPKSSPNVLFMYLILDYRSSSRLIRYQNYTLLELINSIPGKVGPI